VCNAQASKQVGPMSVNSVLFVLLASLFVGFILAMSDKSTNDDDDNDRGTFIWIDGDW